MSKKKTIIILFFIILTAALIRVASALLWHGLIFDEIVSVSVAQQPLTELWTYLKWEMHPPLHFLYLKGWLSLFGSSELSVRLSSVLSGIAAVPAMYLLARAFFKQRRAGLYAAGLTSLALITHVYSVIGRMYAPLFLLGALSLYFFWKALKSYQLSVISYQFRYKFRWILYVLTTLLALYTHLTALVLPVVQLLTFWYLKRQGEVGRRELKPFIISMVIVLLAYLPWFAHFVLTRTQVLTSTSWFFHAPAYDVFLFNVPVNLLVGGGGTAFVSFAALVFVLGLSFAALIKIQRVGSSWQLVNRIKAAHVLALLTLLLSIFSLFALGINHLRFYTLAGIGLILLLSSGLSTLKPLRMQTLVAIALSTLLLVPVLHNLRLPDSGWSRMADFIEQREQTSDVIIAASASDLFSVNYYYQGSLATRVLTEPKLKEEAINDIELAIRAGSLIYLNQKTASDLDKLTDRAERVFLVFNRIMFSDVSRLLSQWFLEHKWQLLEQMSGDGRYQVWLLTRL